MDESTPLKIGDTVIETTPSGRIIEHRVTALAAPPTNPAADPGPYVKLSGGRDPLLIRAEDIMAADWLEHKPRHA